MEDLNSTTIDVTPDYVGVDFGQPTIVVELETKWDTSITLDLTVESARGLAASLLRFAEEMTGA